MANEISITAQLFNTNGIFDTRWNQTDTTNQTIAGGISGVWDVATTLTNLSTTGITTKGYVAMRNIDTANFVEIGYNDSGTLRKFLKLKTGEMALFRVVPTVTVAGQADTATTKVSYMVIED